MAPPAFASAENLAGFPGVLQAIVGLEELLTGPSPVHARCMFCPPCGVATSLLSPVPTWALEVKSLVNFYTFFDIMGSKEITYVL
jgi:hypothetical protein